MDNQAKTPKPKFYETEAFKALDDKWKAKLKRSGFEDIEYSDGSMTSPGSELLRTDKDRRPNFKVRGAYYQSVEEYYRLAGQFLHDFAFANTKERLMWELHANGISQRNIVLALRKRRIRTYKFQVHTILQRLEAEMLKQCNSTIL